MKYEELERNMLENEIACDSWVQGGRTLQMRSRTLVRDSRAMYMRTNVARNNGESRNNQMRRFFR
jgi:hypothetical protein